MSGKYIRVAIKRTVIARAEERCKYCQCWARNSTYTFNIDHIFPISKGGQDILSNLAYSCYGCNNHKSDKTTATDPKTQQEVRLFNPRTDEWNEHFEWSEDALQVIGLTEIGRATIDCLKLNRKGIVNLRRLTIMSGEHPPKN